MEQLYTVLLVDDEEEVIEVMKKKIDWEALGFSVIGSANNGMRALEMAEESLPDVVMTDIKMPYMDGLELSRRLKKEFPDQKILLFTGFDEFEYAKEAVHLEIEEYILKPVNSMELTEILTKLKENLDQEREEKNNVEKLQKYYSESLPLLQSNFYMMLIEGRISEEDLPRYLQEYEISAAGPVYCVVVFHTSKNHVPEGISPLMHAVSMQRYADERLRDRWKAAFFSYLGDIIMMAELSSEEEISALTDDCNRVCRSAARQISAIATAGIGRPTRNLAGIHQSYQGAREAISYRVLYGAERAINIAEVAPKEVDYAGSDFEGDLHPLLKQIRMGDKDSLQNEVNAYVDRLRSNSNSLRQYRVTVIELISSLYRFAQGNEIRLEDVAGDEDFYQTVPEMEFDAIRTWMKETCLALQERLSEDRSSSSKSYVKNAMEYVKMNFSDSDLSLDSVCSALGVSESYFSSVFKKETGKAFISYLTEYRMEEAAKLLIMTGDKNYIIGEKVGYSDANYFSYVFKKHFGTSPSKYRTEHEGTT